MKKIHGEDNRENKGTENDGKRKSMGKRRGRKDVEGKQRREW